MGIGSIELEFLEWARAKKPGLVVGAAGFGGLPGSLFCRKNKKIALLLPVWRGYFARLKGFLLILGERKGILPQKRQFAFDRLPHDSPCANFDNLYNGCVAFYRQKTGGAPRAATR